MGQCCSSLCIMETLHRKGRSPRLLGPGPFHGMHHQPHPASASCGSSSSGDRYGGVFGRCSSVCRYEPVRIPAQSSSAQKRSVWAPTRQKTRSRWGPERSQGVHRVRSRHIARPRNVWLKMRPGPSSALFLPFWPILGPESSSRSPPPADHVFTGKLRPAPRGDPTVAIPFDCRELREALLGSMALRGGTEHTSLGPIWACVREGLNLGLRVLLACWCCW